MSVGDLYIRATYEVPTERVLVTVEEGAQGTLTQGRSGNVSDPTRRGTPGTIGRGKEGVVSQ